MGSAAVLRRDVGCVVSGPVDVLAVMDVDGRAIACVIDACSPGTLRQRQWKAHLPIHDAARAAVAELIEAAEEASATLGHAYHTTLTGQLAEYAHTAYQRLDSALARVQGGAE